MPSNHFSSELFPGATRAAALSALDTFQAEAGDYSAQRNFARPKARGVSKLSPYLSARMLSEEEVCKKILSEYNFSQVEKFIQEVCWRTYWKGWLEQSPAVWTRYRKELAEVNQQLSNNAGLRNTYGRATLGQTGIECFDAWAQELTRNHYLHNHERMWFASIWIFTLGLPWQLGSDFFWQNLLDADAASNTLSWRWVAGLQTVGKHYLARAENIERFTNGRFNPVGQLDEDAKPLTEDFTVPKPYLDLPQPSTATHPTNHSGLLLHEDDLLPEDSPLAETEIGHVCAGIHPDVEPAWFSSESMAAFHAEAFEDARARAASHFNAEAFTPDPNDWQASVISWATERKVEVIHTLYAPVGPWRDVLDVLEKALPPTIQLQRAVRHWDAKFWPHAKAGFFKFRKQIPEIVRSA